MLKYKFGSWEFWGEAIACLDLTQSKNNKVGLFQTIMYVRTPSWAISQTGLIEVKSAIWELGGQWKRWKHNGGLD